MRIRVATICAVGSLALAASMALVWVHSYRKDHRRPASFRAFGEQYTVKSARGRLTLLAPPPAPGTEVLQAKQAVANLSNDNICWMVLCVPRDQEYRLFPHQVWLAETHNWSSDEQLRRVSLAAAWRALHPLLNNADTFGAAHTALCNNLGNRPEPTFPQSAFTGEVLASLDGLKMVLRPKLKAQLSLLQDPRTGATQSLLHPVELRCQGKESVHIDASQMERIRSQWQDRLNLPIVWVPHWLLVVVLLAPTVLYLIALSRGRWRRSHGLCAICGYDLRESEGRCPECGAESAALGLTRQNIVNSGSSSAT